MSSWRISNHCLTMDWLTIDWPSTISWTIHQPPWIPKRRFRLDRRRVHRGVIREIWPDVPAPEVPNQGISAPGPPPKLKAASNGDHLGWCQMSSVIRNLFTSMMSSWLIMTHHELLWIIIMDCHELSEIFAMRGCCVSLTQRPKPLVVDHWSDG